jgi:hypothetical protein
MGLKALRADRKLLTAAQAGDDGRNGLVVGGKEAVEAVFSHCFASDSSSKAKCEFHRVANSISHHCSADKDAAGLR